MWTNRNSSDYTKRLQDRIRFAAYLQNKESVTTGNAVNLPIDSGSGKNGANSEWTQIQKAAPFISPEEYSTIIGTPSYIQQSNQANQTELVIQEFTTVGSFQFVVPSRTVSIEYLLVGGGGGSGGGYDTGGGGGGGGGVVLTGSLNVTGGEQYTIIVGDGGTAGTVDRTIPFEVSGGDGENSAFGSIEALGGGGGFGSRLPLAGNNSGGGSAPSGVRSTTGGRGGGSAGDGNGAGGGGGGSSGDGAAGVANVGGSGGSGTQSALSGTTRTYGAGGRGANGQATATGTAGTDNTGNGARGGSGASGQQGQGAKGGSGIVILRFYR
jgi:hypothetical protein